VWFGGVLSAASVLEELNEAKKKRKKKLYIQHWTMGDVSQPRR